MAEGVQTEQSVKLMLDQGWQSTNDHIAEIRKEIEIERLRLLDERNELELKAAYIKKDIESFEKKKAEHPELLGYVGAAAGLAAGEKGTMMLIEEEVKRRFKEEETKKEIEDMKAKEEGVDLELKTLQTFMELRNKTKIDLNNVTDDDSLGDAMKAADTLKMKKMLMRYKRLKLECLSKDSVFTMKVLRNYFTLIRKVGSLWKRG